jgi:hypothetical protein
VVHDASKSVPAAITASPRAFMPVSPRSGESDRIRAHHGSHVERLEPIKQPVPDDGDYRRGADQLRKTDQCIVGDLAAFERADKPRPHGREDARQHLAVIKFGERRKSRPFADDEPYDLFAMGAVDLANKNLDRLIDDCAERQIARQRTLKRADHGG